MKTKVVLLHIPFAIFIMIALASKVWDVSIGLKAIFLIAILLYGRYYTKEIREIGKKINND